MISVITSIYGNATERAVNFLNLLACVRRQDYSDYELIVVEQHGSEAPVWASAAELAGARYQAIQSPDFSWEWERNVGARMAKGDIFLFFDADIIFPDDYFRFVLDNFNSDFAVGWNRGIWLTKKGKEQYLRDRKYKTEWDEDCWYQIRGEDMQNLGLSAVFRREFFWDVLGGWSENYWDKGRGDSDMHRRATVAAGDVAQPRDYRLPFTILHSFHDARKTQPPEIEDVFSVTWAHPMEVSRRLVAAKLGKLESRTPIDLAGI